MSSKLIEDYWRCMLKDIVHIISQFFWVRPMFKPPQSLLQNAAVKHILTFSNKDFEDESACRHGILLETTFPGRKPRSPCEQDGVWQLFKHSFLVGKFDTKHNRKGDLQEDGAMPWFGEEIVAIVRWKVNNILLGRKAKPRSMHDTKMVFLGSARRTRSTTRWVHIWNWFVRRGTNSWNELSMPATMLYQAFFAREHQHDE